MSSTSNLNEMIEKALTTSSMEEMRNLVKSPYMLVRRALAKNSNTPTEYINRLSQDPVLNVSYIANNNPKSSIGRTYDENLIPPCVSCQNSENNLTCMTGCLRKEDHSF